MTSFEHIFDVVIIGGGCAGLKAAETLVNKHKITNILLLEAQENLGGRTQTIWLDDNPEMPIELGANWIHGTEV